MRPNIVLRACLALWIALTPALASQGSLVMPTTGTVSGLTLVNDINAALDALVTCNSGATQPLNSSAAPSVGQYWCDNSVAGKITLKQYDGASWAVVGVLDTTNHVWTPPIGGNVATSLASGTTTDLGSVPGAFTTITGTTTITSLGSSAIVGSLHFFKFNGSLTFTHNGTSLILPNNGNNITTQAGDNGAAVYLGGGNWQVLHYQPATGAALNATSVFTGAVFFDSPITVTLGSNTNDWNPSGLATANVIRLTCSSAINVTGLVAPATDGKVVVIDNVGATNSCTLTSADTNSAAANRFGFDRPATVRPGRSLTIKYDLTATKWRLIEENVSHPTVRAFSNLKIVNGGTPNNQLTVTADEIVIEDVTNGSARLISVNCTADITASGAGGLDTGSVAQNTGYFLWVLFAPATNTQSCMFSLASAFGSIALPSGYTFAARVGWDFVENAVGKRLNRILCYGRRCQYVVTASSATASLPNIANGAAGSSTVTSPTYATPSVTTFVPATASRIGVMAMNHYNNATLADVLVAPDANYSGILSTNPPLLYLPASVTSINTVWLTLEGSTIATWSSAAGGGWFALGWEDNL